MKAYFTHGLVKQKNISYLIILLLLIFVQPSCFTYRIPKWWNERGEAVATVSYQYWDIFVPMEVIEYKFDVDGKEYIGKSEHVNAKVNYKNHKFKVVFEKDNPKKNMLLLFDRVWDVDEISNTDTCLLRIDGVYGVKIAYRKNRKIKENEIKQFVLHAFVHNLNDNSKQLGYFGSNRYKYEGKIPNNISELRLFDRKKKHQDNGKIFKGIYWKDNPHRFEIFFDEYYPNTTITDIEYNSENIGDEFSKIAANVGENGTIYWMNKFQTPRKIEIMDSFANTFIPRDSLGNEIKNIKIKLYPRDFCKSCPP